jgi:hypothetical protein
MVMVDKKVQGLVLNILNEYFDDIEYDYKTKIKFDKNSNPKIEKKKYDDILMIKRWYDGTIGSNDNSMSTTIQSKLKELIKSKIKKEKRRMNKLKEKNKDISQHIHLTFVLLLELLDNATSETTGFDKWL